MLSLCQCYPITAKLHFGFAKLYLKAMLKLFQTNADTM